MKMIFKVYKSLYFFYRCIWTVDSVLGLSRLDNSCLVTFRRYMVIYWCMYAHILYQQQGNISWSSISADGMKENHWHRTYERRKPSGILVPINLTIWSTGPEELHPKDPLASPIDGLRFTKNPRIFIDPLFARILEGHLFRLSTAVSILFCVARQPHGGWYVWD